MEILAGDNSWRLTRPVEIAVAGGKARLSTLRVSWQDFIPEGEAALNITDIDLHGFLDLLAGPNWTGSSALPSMASVSVKRRSPHPAKLLHRPSAGLCVCKISR